MRSFARLLLLFSLSLGTLLLACNGDKKLGGIVIAIDSNVTVPDDIDGLGLAVSVNGITKFSNVYGVSPSGKVTLPATLVLEEPSDPAQPVHVRIMAFKGGNVRVVRDSITTIPHARVALMRLALSALSFDDGAKGTIDPNEVDRTTDPATQSARGLRLLDSTGSFDPFLNISSKCDPTKELADIDGVCQDAHVDSSTLPDADDASAFAPRSLAECFDVGVCYQGATVVNKGADCTFPFAGDPTFLNVALVMDNVGFRTATGLLVPLDMDPTVGFTVKNGVVTLPEGVCAPNPHLKSLVISTKCPQKTPTTPVVGGGTACPP